MELTSNAKISLKEIFHLLFNAGTENDLDAVLKKHSNIFGDKDNWFPLGGDQNKFGVIENQQSSPIAALIEKITNSIDATLMKKCLEKEIDPKSDEAPKSISEAIDLFYPDHKTEWNLPTYKRKQSEEIQIVADGTRKDTSVIIYDNGEGQHPEKFEDTFLSLLRGNKNEIHFVQGKYNMGGSGSIIFCGKKRYQLIASKRFDGTGLFGFTLIRQYPLSKEEQKTKRNTWYEFLKIDGKIPAFEIENLDLGLHNRKFKTGSVIKLYSYQFPSGYSGFAQDLNQSINEYLFEPALPILTVEKKKRYPNNRVLELDLYGLKRRLESEDGREYLEENGKFSMEFTDELFNKMKVTCFVFKSRAKGWDAKETKKNIRRRFFKNNMSVLFSMNGQVHGHYKTEFITRALKKNLLKDHLLIHVDCTNMDYNFRKELFMASRDRLKDGNETKALRKFLASRLGAKDSRLSEIEKKRKASITVSGETTKELLKNFTNSLPINDELRKLLGDTFKLEGKKPKSKSKSKSKSSPKKEKLSFNPKRYPTYLKFQASKDGETPVTKVPLGGEKSVNFMTDVEDDYFDRVDDPGEMKIALLNFKPNNTTGGTTPGAPKEIEDVLNVEKSSPKEGIIKVVLSPKKEVNVGDSIQVKVSLTDKSLSHDQIFWVKVAEKKQTQENIPKKKDDDEPLGLPEPILVYKEEKKDAVSWRQLGDNVSEEIGYETVMFPLASGDNLERIYINLDSNVLLKYKSRLKNAGEMQLDFAEKKYISSVYFHTLFLYTITKNRKYQFVQTQDDNDVDVDLGTYLRDLFESYYSEFILNFGVGDLMESLSD